MFAVFNRFDRRFEEAARDLGATPWQAFRHVVLPLIAPSLVGIALFGFTLSWDEVARSSQAFGGDQNTLPLELTGLTTTVTNPEIYALGTVTTGRVVRGDRGLAAADPGAAPAPGTPRAAARRMTADGDPRRQSQHHGVDDGRHRARRRGGGRSGDAHHRGESGTGPESIEGYYDEALAVPGLLARDRQGRGARRGRARHRVLRRHRARRRRALARAPVVGIGEAAFHVASLIAGRFSVVTTLGRSFPPSRRTSFATVSPRAARGCGPPRCPCSRSRTATADACARIDAEIAAAMRDDRAEAIVLGCAGMADFAASWRCATACPSSTASPPRWCSSSGSCGSGSGRRRRRLCRAPAQADADPDGPRAGRMTYPRDLVGYGRRRRPRTGPAGRGSRSRSC